MKRLFLIFALAMLLLFASGCGNETAAEKFAKKDSIPVQGAVVEVTEEQLKEPYEPPESAGDGEPVCGDDRCEGSEPEEGCSDCPDCSDSDNNILSLLRKGRSEDGQIAVICNFTPVPRKHYRVGVPLAGFWKEVLNSDSEFYGGSGQGNAGGVMAGGIPSNGFSFSLYLNLPPLGALFFRWQKEEG